MDTLRVRNKLMSYGYEYTDGDDVTVSLLISKNEQYIKHYCNISEVPECLEYVLLDLVCGEFLQTKKALGQLSSIEIENLVQAIRAGDTTVEYNNNYNYDGNTLFSKFVEQLTTGHETELARHRRLCW